MNTFHSCAVGSAILSLTIITVPASAQTRSSDTAGRIPYQAKFEAVPGFNTRLFNNTVARTLGSGQMGYVMVLRDRTGKIVAEINYGYARRPGEATGALSFTRDTTVTWGSVTKMITAAAAIDRTEQIPRLNLDMKMADYVPERWRVANAWKAVTFRHLLSYQGGFDDNSLPSSGPKPTFRNRIAAQRTERAVGSRLYVNANFSAFHFLGKFFTGDTAWKAIEDGYPGGELSYDDYVWSKTRPIWMNVLQTRIFGPLGIKGACGKIDFNGNSYALYYDDPQSSRGFLVNPIDMVNCASGGIVMSANDMGIFLHALTQTNKIITQANYRATFGLTSNNNVVAWNRSRAVTGGRAFEKAGAHTVSGSGIIGNTAEGRVETYVMAFPNGMTAVFATNSSFPDNATWSPSSMLRAAYEAGLAG